MAVKQGRKTVDYERIYQNLSINDSSDPNSLVNIAPSVIADRIKTIPADMFDMSEDDIMRKKCIGETEERLRVTFWQEYVLAMRTERLMSAQNIYMGICTMNEFRKVCDNSAKLLYMIMPITSFYTEAEYLLNVGFRRAKDILKLEPVYTTVDEAGNVITKVDTKLAKLQSDYFKYIVEITRPDEPKQIEVKAQHLHAHKTLDQVDAPLDMAFIDARMAQLESKPADPLLSHAPFQEAVYEPVKAKDDQ